MKVLLTGANGFIGAHVARQILADSCDVYALVRPASDVWRLVEIAQSMTLVECDLTDERQVDRCLDEVRPHCCVHLAWYVEAGKFWNGIENLASLRASLYLAERLAHLGCKRFVGVGTCAEYRSSPGPLSESGPTEATSLYAGAKLALHLALEQLGRATDMAVAWVRLFHLFGPMEDQRRLVPAIILSLLRNHEIELTKGERVRDFAHVQDVASGVWSVARSDLLGPVNIGSGKPVAVREVAAAIGRVLQRRDLLKFGALPCRASEPETIYADTTLLRSRTDWHPRYTMEQGLRQTINWWKERVGR